ncbi:PepSY domain-containing protein [Caulobacter sp. 17J65-9]|uniref:PepSY-associated TM helix domain-containing protein n=1 Tax=Caulobacter sp. 17J65-9 TaxID=2709382 RepID=UPI0013CBB6FC|nr:PepSY domain-containing protein [Caulobacter sp. 17J65-9]NEX93334.1 PepSY domain-containing protein [Caulobacter sp. 17J65-9]
MAPKTVRVWSFVHTWTSLICTAFLLMLCLTGLPLIFHHEIDDALGHDLWKPADASGRLLGYDEILAVALKNRPGEVPLYMSFDEDRPVVNVTTGPRPDSPGVDMHFASYDRTSGELVPPVKGGGVMDFILQLHTDLFLGLPGMLFLGAMGLLFVAAIVSGVVLYAPFMRKLPFGTVRASRAARTKWLDYHNLLGAVTVAWALVVGLTGVVNTLADPITDYWKTHELGVLTARYADAAPVAPTASIDAAVVRAQAVLPQRELQFVAFPGGSYSTAHHYGVFFHGRTPLTKHLTTPVLIDAQTGALTAVAQTPWYVKTLSLSQPLHFGDYGGLLLKVLWALLDLATIVVLGSGLYLWLARRRRSAAP